MVGLNKFDGKGKRQQRLRNHIAKDLLTPKYRQRVIERRRIEDENGNVHFRERYYDELDDE